MTSPTRPVSYCAGSKSFTWSSRPADTIEPGAVLCTAELHFRQSCNVFRAIPIRMTAAIKEKQRTICKFSFLSRRAIRPISPESGTFIPVALREPVLRPSSAGKVPGESVRRWKRRLRMPESWEDKFESLLASRVLTHNPDYLEFLVSKVWRIDRSPLRI